MERGRQGGEGGKVVRKVGIMCGRCQKSRGKNKQRERRWREGSAHKSTGENIWVCGLGPARPSASRLASGSGSARLGLARLGSARFGSARPVHKVGVLCRRNSIFENKVSFRVDETTSPLQTTATQNSNLGGK